MFLSSSWWCLCLKSGFRAEISVQWLESPMWIDYPTLQLLTESEPVAAVTSNCELHQHGAFSEAQRRVLMSSRYQRMGERNITHLPSIFHVLTRRGARLRLVYSSVMTLKTTSQLNAALHRVVAIAFADWHDNISWVVKITFIFRSWLRNIVFWVTGWHSTEWSSPEMVILWLLGIWCIFLVHLLFPSWSFLLTAASR